MSLTPRALPGIIALRQHGPSVLLPLLLADELDGRFLAAGFGESPAGADALGWRAFIVVMLSMFTARGIVGTKKLTGLCRSAS